MVRSLGIPYNNGPYFKMRRAERLYRQGKKLLRRNARAKTYYERESIKIAKGMRCVQD